MIHAPACMQKSEVLQRLQRQATQGAAHLLRIQRPSRGVPVGEQVRLFGLQARNDRKVGQLPQR
jgi:hypothetical protein